MFTISKNNFAGRQSNHMRTIRVPRQSMRLWLVDSDWSRQPTRLVYWIFQPRGLTRDVVEFILPTSGENKMSRFMYRMR